MGGLASATPVAQQEAKSASQSATVLADAPVWAWSAAYIADDYYQTNWHYTLSLEEVPNSGENIHALCNGISNWSEGWCPKNEQQAMEVYSELVVRNFMPNSHAAGVLDESEVSNIPDSLQTGYRTKNYKDDVTVPDPIDNVDAVANRGSTVLTMSTVADQSTTMMPIFKTLSPQPLDSSTIPLLHQTTVPLSVCIMDTATISITLN